MTGTTEGGKKAAETRGHESLSEAGRKGGEASAKSRNGDDSRSSSQSQASGRDDSDREDNENENDRRSNNGRSSQGASSRDSDDNRR